MPRRSLLSRVEEDFEEVSLKDLFALSGKLGRCVGKYFMKRVEEIGNEFYEKKDVFEIWYNSEGEFLFFYADNEKECAEKRKQVL